MQAGAQAVAAQAKRDSSKGSFSLWEVESCIKAADLLLWPHIKKAKETGRFHEVWLFLML